MTRLLYGSNCLGGKTEGIRGIKSAEVAPTEFHGVKVDTADVAERELFRVLPIFDKGKGQTAIKMAVLRV